ncbi:phosphotransacetylase family protein [Planktothrix mougeotii]|uniref:Phosphotransacetylase family protein n=1 Tax=Planktothrix mougeotii LEGE 06226 TaxID=1828728 RepID=A0ABR9U8Y6_9CYAN|nr:phosphotransacetylase family protein [Planktothrix mougeotii]MBE9142594.1 phosphotransacetylase family protein [Planktothrix mougeotii LEGE 06226]
MAESVKYILIGSTEPYTGKSTIALGMAHLFQGKGLDIAYGKPLATDWSDGDEKNDADLQFVAQTLKLSGEQLRFPILTLDETTIHRRLLGEDQANYSQALMAYRQKSSADLIFLEGPRTLQEGLLFDLSVPQMAEQLDTGVLLVARLHSHLAVDDLLLAQQRLGDRLLGIVINDVPPEELEITTTEMQPFLEAQGIPVFGVIPRNPILRSVTVKELVKQLKAQVLCCKERLDLMVESLSVGAMNVSSAMKYFDKSSNMAVVTGGDRTDIQLAALEKSTHCLILTGQLPPAPMVLSRAEDLEVPVLSVDLDTLATVEIIDRAFGQVRLHEPIKVESVNQLMKKYFHLDRFIQRLGISFPVSVIN